MPWRCWSYPLENCLAHLLPDAVHRHPLDRCNAAVEWVGNRCRRHDMVACEGERSTQQTKIKPRIGIFLWKYSQIKFQSLRVCSGFSEGFNVTHLWSVWYCGRQKHVVYIIRKQNDCLLPNNASFFVPHVMNLIKYHPGNFSHYFRTAVQHAATTKFRVSIQ